MTTDQISIAEDLRDREVIRECELRTYVLHKEGHSFAAIHWMLRQEQIETLAARPPSHSESLGRIADKEFDEEALRCHSGSTLWRWYQKVQKKVEEQEDYNREGEPSATITIEINGDVEEFFDDVVAFALGMKRTYQGKMRGRYRVRLQSVDEENLAVA